MKMLVPKKFFFQNIDTLTHWPIFSVHSRISRPFSHAFFALSNLFDGQFTTYLCLTVYIYFRYNISLHYGMTHKVAIRLMEEMPEDALNEAVEAVCKLCSESFTAHRYLYTHLADVHFTSVLDMDLPKSHPWTCPRCPYTAQDLRGIRVHYGVKHKVVLDHLAEKLGVNLSTLRKQMKAGRKKAVSALKTVTPCRFCAMEFKSRPEHAKHIILHLRPILNAQLPQSAPWRCPRCQIVTANSGLLLYHYGLEHPEVVDKLLESELSPAHIDMTFLASAGMPVAAASSSMGAISGTQAQLPANNQQKPVEMVTKPVTVGSGGSKFEEAKIFDDKRFPKCRLCDYRLVF